MRTTVLCWLQILWAIPSLGQGTFVNLDFEQGRYVPTNPESPNVVAASNALPGWSAYLGGTEAAWVWYNSTEGPGITLFGPPGGGSTSPSFHGSYSVALGALFPGVASSIRQSGQVPSDAKSLIFYVYNMEMEVMFAGQPVTTYDMGGINGPDSYHQYIADIAAFAGQTGELCFSGYGGSLDFIQFSSNPIPEPKVTSQVVAGLIGLILVRTIRRRTAQPDAPANARISSRGEPDITGPAWLR